MQAFVHLTQYMVHPLMLLLAVGALPVLLLNRLAGPFIAIYAAGFLFAGAITLVSHFPARAR